MQKMKIKAQDLFDLEGLYIAPFINSFEYPWEALLKLKEYISEQLEHIPSGFELYKEGVLIGKDVKISKMATINPPCILGHGTEIRPGAYIRGEVIIGNNCVIGNSSELKSSILLNNVQVPHYNYVGNSILGNNSHLGAGTILSNLKSDHKCVIIHADIDYQTGMRKLGSILGDFADIGCSCVLSPGTIIGKGTRVYPLTHVRGVVMENMIVKSTENIIPKGV